MTDTTLRASATCFAMLVKLPQKRGWFPILMTCWSSQLASRYVTTPYAVLRIIASLCGLNTVRSLTLPFVFSFRLLSLVLISSGHQALLISFVLSLLPVQSIGMLLSNEHKSYQTSGDTAINVSAKTLKRNLYRRNTCY